MQDFTSVIYLHDGIWLEPAPQTSQVAAAASVAAEKLGVPYLPLKAQALHAAFQDLIKDDAAARDSHFTSHNARKRLSADVSCSFVQNKRIKYSWTYRNKRQLTEHTHRDQPGTLAKYFAKEIRQ